MTAPHPPADAPTWTVAVRALCGFTARAGDLDLRFTPSPTGLQGMLGHQLVAARRPASYETEIPLAARYEDLAVRGRADGFDPARGRLEEIKTHRGDLARQPANHRALHWAQAKVYGAMLCEARALPGLTLALVYYDLGSGQETVFEEAHDAASLRAFFEARCRDFIDWARQEAAHRQARNAALAQLAFPHAEFRAGQRALAEAVWRAARAGRPLMAQAPTGIGKTVGTLFPLLRAMPAQGLDRVFFLAAKTPGRQLALDALATLCPSPGAPLRVLELTARDKACEHPDRACHGESCPLARGFYDRLPAARAAAVARGRLDQPALREVARAQAVCPYWLSHELARWADVVVGDYNYFFDSSALLHALTQEQGWQCAVLVDEAHNLLERARGMYSAWLREADLRAVRRAAPPALKQPLARLARAWREARRGLAAPPADDAPAATAPRPARGAAAAPYAASDDLPARLVQAVQQAAAAIADHLAESPQLPAGDLQQFHFDLLAFARLADTFGPHSVFEASEDGPPHARARGLLGIRNLLPAAHLAPRFASAPATVLFSATLGPAAFCRDTLGLPADAAWLDVDSPFHAEQLAVRVARGISTRWADRDRSLDPIADLVADQYARRPGNYLAFFSSYDYLQRAAQRLAQRHPQVPQWSQSAGMREDERRAFIARFEPGGQGVGFAVLGGSFGEGIDLPGDRLVGAFIATLGLPQVNPVNELLRERLESAFGTGFDYAYLYPGLRKVVQAAGRVIRTREDRGVVWLIDDRFARPDVRALLPAWWQPQAAGSASN